MRSLAPAALAAALLACAGLPGASHAPLSELLAESDGPGPPAALVLVSVGGLTPERYLGDGTMPTLAAMAAAGAAAEGVDPVVPAAARAAHATLLTGVAPAEHGVIADRLLGERGLRRTQSRHASLLHAATLWQLVAEAGGSVASFDWPTTAGASIAELLPDVGPDRRGETWQQLAAASATPWIAERVRVANRSVETPGAARDRLLVDLACAGLDRSPRLVLLRLRGGEAAESAEGPRGADVAKAFTGVDAELARLLRCANRQGRLAQMAFAVVGDRALLATHTAVRPNVWLTDAGLIGPQGRWKAITRSNGGSSFVYALDAQAALEARQLFEERAETTHAFTVVSAEEMIRLHADPTAWFGLEAEPGFVFEDDHVGQALGPARERAAGGYLLLDAEQRTGFVAFGRGVRRGVEIPSMSQLDVGPTLAALLGLKLEPVAGRALVGLLRVGPAGAHARPDTGRG